MYVCVCNAVTDKQIKKAAANGACSLEDLQDELRVATCCGRCADCAREVLNEARAEIRFDRNAPQPFPAMSVVPVPA